MSGENLGEIPFENYNYDKVIGSCCENIVGFIPVPLGMAGPLLIDGKFYHIPMATTEGTLVASTNRGCSALSVRNLLKIQNSKFKQNYCKGFKWCFYKSIS